MGAFSQGKNPVAISNGSMARCGVSESMRNDGPKPQQWLYGKAPSFVSQQHLAEARRKQREKQWLNQFAEVTEAQRRESERRRHLHKNVGSMTLF